MKKFLVPLFFVFLVLVFAAIGPNAPAEDPEQTAEEGPAPTAGAAQETEPPETFVPSEELPADSAISFPVDI